MKRQRGRSRRSSSNNSNPNRSMESNGPDVKVRGTAKQIFDKYEALARDASGGGSRVKAENYRQHAEHYLRIVNELEQAKQAAAEAREAERQKQEKENPSEEPKKSHASKSKKDDVSQGEQPAELDVVKPEASNDATSDTALEVADESSKTKSTGRRKAPSRKSDSEDVIEAAE